MIQAPLTLLRNARCFAPEPLGETDLLLGGGQILAIGPQLPQMALPHEELDCSGLYLAPGLIDAHVHLTGGGGEAGPSTRVPRVQFSTLTTAGVTGVVGVLGTDGTTRTVRDLVAVTLGLREEGLSAWCYTGSYRLPPPTLTGSVRDDIVYIDPIIGVGELALSDHRSSQPTLDELLRVASDAYVAGMMSNKAGVLHLHMGSGPRGFELIEQALAVSELPPRVFHPTHINREDWLFKAAGDLAQRGCTVDISAFPPDGKTMTAAQGIARWLRAGLPEDRLTCSSDGAGCLPTFDDDGRLLHMDVGRPDTLLDSIRTLLADGFVLEEVLPIFTQNVARQMRLARKGRLAIGMDADVIALTPKGELRHTIARGRLCVRDGDAVQRGLFEAKPETA